ncbi:hypothetical protein P20652_1724 [Pseudoalteromonas sp. BSi20652]|nr:hypothetical protein P20652_1724 [Pseudoalteromonas sp. BSi20652]
MHLTVPFSVSIFTPENFNVNNKLNRLFIRVGYDTKTTFNKVMNLF